MAAVTPDPCGAHIQATSQPTIPKRSGLSAAPTCGPLGRRNRRSARRHAIRQKTRRTARGHRQWPRGAVKSSTETNITMIKAPSKLWRGIVLDDRRGTHLSPSLGEHGLPNTRVPVRFPAPDAPAMLSQCTCRPGATRAIPWLPTQGSQPVQRASAASRQ